tara:strand:+ start:55 stop:381 length:327 start_codon:yes stop_codon:yes gene_type:complete
MEEEKTNKREVTNIELEFKDKEDIINLASKDEFVSLVMNDSLEAITEGVEDNLDSVDLFNILNISVMVKLERSNFQPVLNKITQYYAGKEDYDKCIEIQSLIKKLKNA